jgi:CubicO group peptidase (beta-lactamase class C family)
LREGSCSKNMQSFSAHSFDWTPAVLEQAVAEGLVPGAVVAAFHLKDSSQSFVFFAGNRRIVPTHQPMLDSTVFDWASLTKPLCTAPLVFRAIQRGWLSLETQVRSLLLDAPQSWSGITVGHLLAHSAGFRAWAPVWQELQARWGLRLSEVSLEQRRSEFRKHVVSEHPEVAPGRRVLYSDFSFLILGFILEDLYQLRLQQIWERQMPGVEAGFRTVLRPALAKQPIDESCAATEVVEWRGGALQGEVHDENCWSLGGSAGHAGLFGNMSALMAATRRIFDSTFLDPQLRALMLRPVIGPEGPRRTLGWDVPDGPESSAGPTLASRSGVVGHLGFTGTSLWIDQQSQWGFSVLSGRVHLGRENTGIRKFRPRIHEALAIDLRLDAG